MGRKSYFSLMAEGFKMMKEDPKTDPHVTLREWTFIVEPELVKFQTENVSMTYQWLSFPKAGETKIETPGFRIERIGEQNRVLLSIEGTVRLEADMVCSEQEWTSFRRRFMEMEG